MVFLLAFFPCSLLLHSSPGDHGYKILQPLPSNFTSDTIGPVMTVQGGLNW
jgi:hypothetical protein